MRHAILAALAGAALLAGCGKDDRTATSTQTVTVAAPGATAPGAQTAPSAASATPSTTIRIAEFLYEPDPVTVKAGQPIPVTNADSAPHTVTEEGGDPSFDSGTIKGKQSGSVTFSTAGTFKYFCEFHATMKGTVTVTQ